MSIDKEVYMRMNWIYKLVDKVTKKETSNNTCFSYYKKWVIIQSGTWDYMDVIVSSHWSEAAFLSFNFDYATMELSIVQYENDKMYNTVVDAFKKIYGNRITILEED